MDHPLVRRFLALPPSAPQELVQSRLEEIHRAFDLQTVMDSLFRWELRAGYLTREKLEEVERLEFPDPQTGLRLRIQINYARTRYTDAQTPSARAGNDASAGQTGPAAAPAAWPCLLCKENIGGPGKEALRVYELSPDERCPERRLFLQLTPFPLYPYHFVPVLAEHVPQRIDRQSVADMQHLLHQAPEYTVVSNSDVRWAGSSILDHLHYQMLKGLRLPVMDAAAVPGLSLRRGALTVEFLDYPLAAFRIRGPEEAEVGEAVATLVALWKAREPGANTVNLALAHAPGSGEYLFTVLLRNPAYRTPEALRRFKSEGVGVIEASGEAILPVPRGPEAEAMWREIRSGGLRLVRDLIGGNSPPRDAATMRELLAQLAQLAQLAEPAKGTQ
jgi:UDPglucose--hexose-1-phosphate uridylyltransferase